MPGKKSVQTCRRMWKSPSSPPSQEDKYFQHWLRTCTLRAACYSAGHTLTSHACCDRCQPLTAPSTHCQVPKMLGWIIFLFFICPSQSCVLLATHDEAPVVAYIPNGEPYFLKCPGIVSEDSYNVTWFKDVSKTNISTDLHTRVYQDNNFLKFLPAKLEDSGFYSCVVRRAESCWQVEVQVDVFQNEDGLCYNNKAFIEAQPYMQGSLTIECPSVSDLVQPETAQFNWFKECKPLDLTNKRYITLKKSLIISDVTSQDDGNYTCMTSFIHNGTSYNVSRTIRSSLLEMKVVGKPVIVYPKNNVVDAELGAPITITCQVLFSENLLLYWNYNESFISDYFDDRLVSGDQYEAVNKEGDKVSCQNLTFSSVKEEDYGLKFYCYADLFPALNKAYFMLKKPDPNYQALLIAFFVTAACFIITTIIVVKIFKVDIVLWYRSSCFSHPRQNDGKLYDAYILYPRNAIGSFAYDMDLFVLKLLPEVLEKQCDYRLFIIGRDDLPGQALADLVDEAISQSRRVIVVLGQVSSEANLGEDFERKIAMYDALIRNEVKVILIEMDKITDYSFMPESIKFIRQKQGVVRWKETFTEAALSPNTRFWKNVRYRMPPAPRYSNKTLDYRITEDLLP